MPLPLHHHTTSASLHHHLTQTVLLRLLSRGHPPSPACASPTRTSPYHHHRTFHSTSRTLRHEDHHDQTQTHYDTLGVHPSATPAEIKKSFYRLSLLHHPDHNPSSPPHHFHRLSEAYSILSHPDKRSHYDRDILRLRHSHKHHPKGSYHSSQAGGRPPSGLSRRRGTFTGPPPSFFRSGGYGAHSARRKAAHDSSTGGAENASSNTSDKSDNRKDQDDPAWAAGTSAGGMGPGQDPFRHGTSHGGWGQVPHFDSDAHERQGRRVSDERRAQRAATGSRDTSGGGGSGAEGSAVARFVIVSGILVTALVVPGLVDAMSEKNKRRRQEKKMVAKAGKERVG